MLVFKGRRKGDRIRIGDADVVILGVDRRRRIVKVGVSEPRHVVEMKAEDRIQVGEAEVMILLLHIKTQTVKVGVTAPRHVLVMRADAKRREPKPG